MALNKSPARSGLNGRDTVPPLDLVKLRRRIETEDGVIEAGATGTIVHRYAEGQAFEVEFTGAFPAVVTCTPDQLDHSRG